MFDKLEWGVHKGNTLLHRTWHPLLHTSDTSNFSNFYLQKDLDFTLKVIGGDISTIPGLSGAIEVCANSTSPLNIFSCILYALTCVYICLLSTSLTVRLLTEYSGLFENLHDV